MGLNARGHIFNARTRCYTQDAEKKNSAAPEVCFDLSQLDIHVRWASWKNRVTRRAQAIRSIGVLGAVMANTVKNENNTPRKLKRIMGFALPHAQDGCGEWLMTSEPRANIF